MITTPLLVYAKKGARFKPGSLVGDCAVRADYVSLPNGDTVGVVHALNARARQILSAQTGIAVLPPYHRPIAADHVTLLAYAGAAAGDTGYDVAEKLFRFHRMPWFHPEETALSATSIADLL